MRRCPARSALAAAVIAALAGGAGAVPSADGAPSAGAAFPAGGALRDPGAAVEVSLPRDVPFVSQGPELCGGAALAMVLRYWGATGVQAADYRDLVVPGAGGIRAGDLAEAARGPGWRAAAFSGTLAGLREQISRGRPVIALVRVRPGRYHYVVVTGLGPDGIRYHDPAVGPGRKRDAAAFLADWKAAEYWALVVTPAPGAEPSEPPPVGAPAAAPAPCDSLVDAGVLQAQAGNPARAESLLVRARDLCPRASRPWTELAGLRFQQARWPAAARLAGEAVARAPGDTLAWKLLAAARFMADEPEAALAAWNAVGEPRVDLVSVRGLHRTRYPVLIHYLGLAPESLLTPSRLRRTERRLDAFPTVAAGAVRYRPGRGGAQVEAAVVERPVLLGGPWEALGIAAHAAGARELRLALTGPTGNGARLDGAWRWSRERPLLGLRATAPAPRGLHGLITVEGFRESETYRGPAAGRVVETRRRASAAWSEWLSGAVRLGGSLAYDHWDPSEDRAAAGLRVEAASPGDRLRAFAAVETWFPGPGFTAARTGFGWSPLPASARFDLRARGALESAGGRAPLALVPGAGVGQARRPLLRAHPLLRGGILEGSVFGRRLLGGGLEATWWALPRLPLRAGVAGFVDAARAWNSPLTGGDPRGRVDAGVGLRLGGPGGLATLRLNAAWGLTDRAHAVTLVAVPWKFS